jgi:tRNA G18 (ribose-2'-O)-methylase SpoU
MEKNEKSTSLFELEKNLSIALVMGNELEWVSETAQKMSEHICHLPMLGKKESLNVAVAAWIGMYYFVE